MIAIIDYGMGNLRSVQKAFELFSAEKVIVSSSIKDISSAKKIVFPGVGAFKKAMEELVKRGLTDVILRSVQKGKPFLGICLGLQLLFSESEEGGAVKGLDILKGRVKKFEPGKYLKIPHMGWNRINSEGLGFLPNADPRPAKKLKILDGVKNGAYMYFVHSYYVQPDDKDVIICATDYGINFASAVRKDNIYGFQFHPEKSQTGGLKIIKNFVDLE